MTNLKFLELFVPLQKSDAFRADVDRPGLLVRLYALK